MSGAAAVELTGETLTAAQVSAIGEGARIDLAPGALERLAESRAALESVLAAGQRVYGAGPLLAGADAGLSPADVEHDIVRGAAAGTGAPLERRIARAALAIRLNGLLRGYSGVRPELVRALAALLNAGLAPYVPSKGSAGASGDLAPSAHAFLPLLGEGAFLGERGEPRPAAAELREHRLAPFALAPKEAISVLNGTHFMAALGVAVAARAARLLDTADAVAALTIDALRGASAAFDPRVHELRPLPGQLRSAEIVRRLLEGSQRVDTREGHVHDAYSLRCVPQVHGSARHAHAFLEHTVELELNAVTDNPLVFTAPLQVISAGNFHGQPLALVFDTLRIALADLAAFSERRTFRLVSPSLNGGLPPFLVGTDGRGLGYMLSQIACTTLVAELRVLAQPVSLDTVPTLDNVEDHVSFGMTGGLLGLEACDVLETVLATEALLAAQGLESGASAAPAVAALHGLIRTVVPPLAADRLPADDLEAVRRLLASDAWETAIRELLG
jgi:histidine ammonia-lyase